MPEVLEVAKLIGVEDLLESVNANSGTSVGSLLSDEHWQVG